MNLADKTIINILAKSGEAVLLLISSVVMVRFLNKEEYGTFLQIMLIMNTAIMFTFLGLPQSIYYYFHEVSNKISFVCKNIAISILVSCTAAMVIFFLSSYLVQWFNNPLLADYRYILVALVMLRGSIIMRDPLLISHGSLLLNAFSAIVSNGLFYIPVIVFAIFSVGLSTLLKVLLVSCAVDFLCFFAVMYWFVSRLENDEVNKAEGDKRVGVLEQLRYAFPIGLSGYIGIIGRQIDQYIVSIFFNPQNFAVYSRGAMRIPILSSMQYTVNNIMMPYYVQDYRDGNIEKLLSRFHLCIEKVAKINFPVFVFLFMAAPLLISILYTERYIGAVPVFRAYLFMLLLNITTYAIIPRATGQTKSIFYASLLNILANILLSCLLVPVWGVSGAAIATVLCGAVSSLYYLIISCRILGVGFGKIFPWKYLAKLLGLSLAAGCLAFGANFLLGYFFISQLVHLLSGAGIFCMIYLCFIMKFDLLTADDFVTLSNWLRFDVESVFRKITFS